MRANGRVSTGLNFGTGKYYINITILLHKFRKGMVHLHQDPKNMKENGKTI
jgi:hypothetical protein